MKYCSLICALLLFAISAGISGCGGSGGAAALTLKVEKGTFEISIPSFGELQAVTSTPITVPPQLRGSQTLAWIVTENTFVHKGETVIRLDPEGYKDRIQKESFEIEKLNLEIYEKRSALNKEKKEIDGQLALTSIEKEMAEVYGAKDEEIFPRNKIIEDAVNLEFLEKKKKHFKDKKSKLELKSNAELDLLELKRKTHKMKLDQYSQALEALDIKAPHEGFLIYHRNYRGEKPRLGSSVWAGRKIAMLPNVERMEATVYVLESEAAGLKEGLGCLVRLDCSPQRNFSGKVTGIDTIAKPLEKESPLKYFQVKISLDETDRTIMKPGNQVRATIFVQRIEGVVSIPNQALFFKGEDAFVNVINSGAVEKRKVETGVRSLTRTVVSMGLSEGDLVVLGDMEGKDGVK
jgi:RND family efflux transporter MFP subunit